MNYRRFQYLYEQSSYNEIKVIGKDVKKGNHFYHILGMTLKDKQVSLYILEFPSYMLSEEELCPENQRPRNSMKRHMEEQRNESLFMRIRELQGGGKIYDIAGASSGSLENTGHCEVYFLFQRMMEAGWILSEYSPFFDVEWDSIVVTNVELQGEYESLPEWTEDMHALVYTEQQGGVIEQPVLLECGKTKELDFSMAEGKIAHCYINKVFILDIWEEQTKRFADSEYIEKMLQYMSKEEFEEMKKNCFEALEQQCPKGKCYMALYYECDQEIGLQFYDSEYLDTIPKPKEGKCSSMFVTVRPEEKTGIHGFGLKGAVIQKPISKETESIEVELFSYSKRVEQKLEKL